ncbi:MAG: threonine--tRNA ligase [Candidatus Aenigmarchaeota archaeon ex4484_224]|nr:MAG: threonine--tRNA ligase [Candidatus Aenigmarchaeota archaeon ex4484_224]
MKAIEFHVDKFEYLPIKKEIREAEETKKEKVKFENGIVVFVTIEKNDNEKSAEALAKEIFDYSSKIGTKKVLIYPYAHLSSNLEKPSKALEIIKILEKKLSKKLKVQRAPFGWTKKFSIEIKGHPLAEQFREILEKEEKEEVSKSLRQEEKVKSEWYILTPKGKLIEIKKFNFSKYKNLEKFAKYEISKSRAVQQIPPHVKLMKKLKIADYERGSDPGNLRYYPNGRLIKSLLEQFVTLKTIEYGASEVETPIMYDYEHPALKTYLNRFPARHYIVLSGNKRYFLRFSACFGQFLIAKDLVISYKDLPLKMYELTRYSFRREQSGEIVGLRRLRAFTMPDMHTLCKDMEEAKKEFKNQFKFGIKLLKEIGLDKKDYEVAIRFTKDFWKENKDFIISLAKEIGKPVLIEMWNYRYAYFDPKFEFNFVDALDKASALTTVQIDHENAERFGISFVDKDGKKRYPKILHCSPSGAIERVIYVLLEKAYLESKKGKVPSLPLWLSPTQVRIIPVSKKFLNKAKKIAKEIEKEKIRVDIDDRDETIGKKIKEAEESWVPFIAVIGEKEVKSKKLSVRVREKRRIEKMTVKKLIETIKKKVKNKPYLPLPMPKLLSQRPIYP